MKNLILNLEKYGNSVLRIGMSAIILWFSFEQFINTSFWTAYVPDFAVNLTGLTASTLVILNASFEIVFGILLLIGVQIRLSALLLSLHLIEIAFTIGYGETAVRDIGLALSLFVVFMNGSDIISFTNKNNMEQPNNKSKSGLIISVLVIVIVALVAVFVGREDNDDKVVQQQPTTTLDTNIPSAYKDGVYTSTGSYMSPGGKDEIDVTVTLAKNVITDVSIVSKPGDDVSKKYMKVFADNYKTQVVGKNLSEIKLDKVSGSSLTPIGFNDAISQIRQKAKI